MPRVAAVWLVVAMSVSAASVAVVRVPVAQADAVTVNALDNDTPATVFFDDASGLPGHSGSVSTLLTQLHVTHAPAVGTPITFDTFSIDLFHSVSAGQTYQVTPRDDVATVFANGSAIAYVFQTFGLGNLASDPVRAAAVQLALWDLALDNHTPTSFALDPDGSYSSGDENVFSVVLDGPLAGQIATLTNQYLQAAVGATAQGGWLDAAPAGDAANRGQSLLLPVPAPASGVLAVAAIGAASLGGWWAGDTRGPTRRRSQRRASETTRQ